MIPYGFGPKADKIGDILCLEDGCQVVVAEEVADFILQHWRQVHEVPIEVWGDRSEQIARSQNVSGKSRRQWPLRLDAVAAAGFGTSRAKIAREIKNERVKINWKPTTSPAHEVKVGDAVRFGRGRAVVEQITGTTKKVESV